MDELSDYSSPVIEFKVKRSSEKQSQYVDNCSGTDPLPPSKDEQVETVCKMHAETQTQIFATMNPQVDEKKLATWLRKIYPQLETELLKGPTPLPDNYVSSAQASLADETKIQTYQKITLSDINENSQGLATWLSVHTNNAPILVLTAVAPHDDGWCEHVNGTMKIFIPKRMKTGNFIVFTEVQSVPLKACLKSLCTNSFNKNIFAGSTLDGDIYIWKYTYRSSSSTSAGNNNTEVEELFRITSTNSAAMAIDWASEHILMTCHVNGGICQWRIGKEMLKEGEYQFKPTPSGTSTEITAIVCLSLTDFVVGTKDGAIYHCFNANISGGGSTKMQIEITTLRKHLFMVATLLKTRMAGQIVVISCDLSGEVYYHDIRNADDDTTANVIVQIPLPFKNAIACSCDANIIYAPGDDGSLECYRIRDGIHSFTKGALRGKGNLIKSSDNGCWMVTGLYGNEFQIFYVEN